MRLRVAAASQQGQKRRNNEDYIYHNEEIGLFIVADGCGGEAAGETASLLTVETIKNAFLRREYSSVSEFLRIVIDEANSRIFSLSTSSPDYLGMATTVTVAKIEDRHLFVANVGDSRTYILRGEEIFRITHDHSKSEELVREGVITPAEALVHPGKNVLTRAVGGDSIIDADISNVELMDGDFLFLCSDGLLKVFSDEDILAVFQSENDVDNIVETLLTKAVEMGSSDDISLIVAQIGAEVCS